MPKNRASLKTLGGPGATGSLDQEGQGREGRGMGGCLCSSCATRPQAYSTRVGGSVVDKGGTHTRAEEGGRGGHTWGDQTTPYYTKTDQLVQHKTKHFTSTKNKSTTETAGSTLGREEPSKNIGIKKSSYANQVSPTKTQPRSRTPIITTNFKITLPAPSLHESAAQSITFGGARGRSRYDTRLLIRS